MKWGLRDSRVKRVVGAGTDSGDLSLTELIADLRDGDPSLRMIQPVGAETRWHRLGLRLFGGRSASSVAIRVALDSAFVAVSIAVGLLLSGVFWDSIAVVAVAALLVGPSFVMTGTYGYIGFPSRSRQFSRLAVGVALGATLEALAMLVVGSGRWEVAVMAGGWAVGGLLGAAARAAKTLFEDRFRLLPRTTRWSDRPVRHVLLIGGAGYIGSVLSRQLLDRGYHVTVLDKLLYGDEGVRGILAHPRFRLVVDDFRNVDSLVEAARGADAVVHLGAIVGDPACALNPPKAVDINYRATKLIRDVTRGLGVQRLIFASTCSVYGVNAAVIDEASELNPVSVYAASKIASERAMLEDAENGLSPTVVRLATVFGWSPRPRFDLVVNLLTARATLENEILIINGKQWRPFIHVSDVGRALIACLEAPTSRVRGRIFNVGDDELNLALNDLAKSFEKQFPGLEVKYRDDDDDRRTYRVSFARIVRTLGFRCETSVAQGIEEMRRMIVETGITAYAAPRYSNVKHLAEDPIVAFGPDTDERDVELPLLRSFYEPVQDLRSVK